VAFLHQLGVNEHLRVLAESAGGVAGKDYSNDEDEGSDDDSTSTSPENDEAGMDYHSGERRFNAAVVTRLLQKLMLAVRDLLVMTMGRVIN